MRRWCWSCCRSPCPAVNHGGAIPPRWNWNSTFDLVCGVVLLAAETYSWLVLMLGYVQVAWSLRRRPALLPADIRQWPTVDVLDSHLQRRPGAGGTPWAAAMGLDWPADKLRIHILDDGKREEFRAFAESAPGSTTSPALITAMPRPAISTTP